MKIFILLPADFCPIFLNFLIWIYSSYTYVLLNTVLHIFIYIFICMFMYFEKNFHLLHLFCQFIFVFLWFNIFYSDIFCLLILSTSVYNLLLNSFTAILVTIFISFDYSISISLLFSITDL